MDFVVLELIRELQHIDLENEYFIFVNEGPDNKVIKETANFKINIIYDFNEDNTLPVLNEIKDNAMEIHKY